MSRDEFLRRLATATRRAVAFACEGVEAEPPATRRYDILLVPHHDGSIDPPLTDLWRRSNDGYLFDLSAADVADELWHDGRVPEWVDFGVHSGTDVVWYLELRCSRTLADEDALWYADAGLPPFKIVGPPMPPLWVEDHTIHGRYDSRGERYRLVTRERFLAHPHDPWAWWDEE